MQASTVDSVQINIKAPAHLKDWAKSCADSNYQSLSGFIVKLMDEAKQRDEKKKRGKKMTG